MPGPGERRAVTQEISVCKLRNQICNIPYFHLVHLRKWLKIEAHRQPTKIARRTTPTTERYIQDSRKSLHSETIRQKSAVTASSPQSAYIEYISSMNRTYRRRHHKHLRKRPDMPGRIPLHPMASQPLRIRWRDGTNSSKRKHRPQKTGFSKKVVISLEPHKTTAFFIYLDKPPKKL